MHRASTEVGLGPLVHPTPSVRATGQEIDLNIVTRSVEIGGKTLTFETGKLAKQASGAVVVRSGDSMVLVTAVLRGPKPSTT